jgi:hypothetical protein
MSFELPLKGGDAWFQIMEINKEGLAPTLNEFPVAMTASAASKEKVE